MYKNKTARLLFFLNAKYFDEFSKSHLTDVKMKYNNFF